MSLSGMDEILRSFDRAQGVLEAKRSSVMPAQAGIQVFPRRGGSRPALPVQPWIPVFTGMTIYR